MKRNTKYFYVGYYMPFGASGVYKIRVEAYTGKDAIEKVEKQEKYSYNHFIISESPIITKYSYMDEEYKEYERNKNKGIVYTGKF